ncbi:carboxylating nicotinate-nucleotide diphosphorylase [Phorcysia thermohydrogeniphila]|uniref:Probable nicotinate-nucleotide pyrophosphorylase [carboxylating] n=1 Tax=Phorcysia thermohydrogeniphila TaxID=936138 RepID=A0A4R1GQ68_9BACT|nr:carboxylating nicotinate-nucleotide diphosphorylase [Phorcysia thermohydrogeniphila]TCK06662.1 nicotinate-nucleotide pyrophosphorylase [carboxylating] [Phorcysia thermohydrogeniphila]
MNDLYLRKLILSFLEEDLGIIGDLTSGVLPEKQAEAELIAGEDFILCGAPVFEKVFTLLDGRVSFSWFYGEGAPVKKGDVIGKVSGSIKTLLTCERTALNLLQKLSGIATETRRYVEILKGSRVKLLDTRKTTPGLRLLEKYATRVGGALNHRFGLYDAVMVKDNHIKAFGGVQEAVKRVAQSIPVTTKIEVEVESDEQLTELLEVIDLVDIVMLDNWELKGVEEAVKRLKEAKPSVKVELSGGITLEKLRVIRELPVDYVSTSKIITAAKWVDVSLEVV